VVKLLMCQSPFQFKAVMMMMMMMMMMLHLYWFLLWAVVQMCYF